MTLLDWNRLTTLMINHCISFLFSWCFVDGVFCCCRFWEAWWYAVHAVKVTMCGVCCRPWNNAPPPLHGAAPSVLRALSPLTTTSGPPPRPRPPPKGTPPPPHPSPTPLLPTGKVEGGRGKVIRKRLSEVENIALHPPAPVPGEDYSCFVTNHRIFWNMNSNVTIIA